MTPSRTPVPTLFMGMARSGTTLLGRLACRYLEVAAVNEGNFESWLLREAPGIDQVLTQAAYERLLPRLAAHMYFQFLYLKEHAAERVVEELRPLVEERTPRGLARAALQLASNRWRLPLLGHEDPAFMDAPQAIASLFPDCKIVHIVRDPRDVAVSLLQMPWGPNNVVVAAFDWNRKVKNLRDFGAQIGPDRYLEIRYEDLLRRARQTMSHMMRFVCGTVDEAKLERFVDEMDRNPLRNNSGNWRGKLSAYKVQLMEAAAREQMADSGYIPEQPPRRLLPFTYQVWKLHHRAIQLRNILTGRLHLNGAGRVAPEAPKVPVVHNHPQPPHYLEREPSEVTKSEHTA